MGTAFGFILSDDMKEFLRNQLNEPCPHCYFCGSKYVHIVKGDKGSGRTTCLICGRTCLVDHEYRDVL